MPSVVMADIEAERRILGICIKHPDLMLEACDKLRPEHFTAPFHKKVWECIYSHYKANKPVSYTNLYAQLRGTVDKLADALAAFTEAFIAPVELKPSVEAVLSAWERRRFINDAEELRQLAETESNIDLVKQTYIERASGWTQTYDNNEASSLEILGELFVDFTQAKEGNTPYRGPTTGLIALDSAIRCFENGSLIVIGGRPSMGKTALALNIAAGIAQRHGPVFIHSLEMTRKQAMRRLLQAKAKVTADDIDDGGVHDPKIQRRIEVAFNELYTLRIDWCDKRGLTAPELCAGIRKKKRQYPDLALWVIDYLNLIRLPNDRNRPEHLKIGDVCHMIRDTAGDLNLPVLLLAQLNRSLEKRDKKEPGLADLRDSGNIEEFADLVAFVHRPAYFEPDGKKQHDDCDLRLIIAKNRITGRTSAVPLWIELEHQYVRSRLEQHRKWEFLNDTPEGMQTWW